MMLEVVTYFSNLTRHSDSEIFLKYWNSCLLAVGA